MIFFVPRGWEIFFSHKRLGDFFIPRGWVICFCPKRLGDLFYPERLGDFLLSGEVG